MMEEHEALILRDPPMESEDVRWLQRQINRSKYVFPKLKVDGVFGPHTAYELKQLLYRIGHPDPIHALSKKNWQYVIDWALKGGTSLPLAWRRRAALRRNAGFRKGAGFTVKSWFGLHPPPSDSDKLRIYTRDELGLLPPSRTTPSQFADGKRMVLHWQGPGSGAEGLEAAKAQWRTWQNYHKYTRGWNDIGYHYGIPRGCPVGTVFTGRGDGVQGAHCGSSVGNSYTGVVLMFGENDGAPTSDQLKTLELFCTSRKTNNITGHWEWSATSCPGTAMKSWVKTYRRGVN